MAAKTKTKKIVVKLRRMGTRELKSALTRGIVHFYGDKEKDGLDTITLFKQEYEELGEPKRLKVTLEGLKS